MLDGSSPVSGPYTECGMKNSKLVDSNAKFAATGLAVFPKRVNFLMDVLGD